MPETTGTVLKILSALTSPKAAIKYITVGAFLILSWKYLDKMVSELGLPAEYKSIAILLIGLGGGSLVGHSIVGVFSFFWGKYTRHVEANKTIAEHKRIQAEQAVQNEKNDKIIVDRFVRSFQHLTVDQRHTLRSLTKGDQVISLQFSELKSLDDASYIQRISHIETARYLVRINPLLKKLVADHWQAEVKANADNFFRQMTDEKERLLEIMEQENDLPIEPAIIEVVSQHWGCIFTDDDYEGGICFQWRELQLEEFESRTGKKFLEEVWIDDSRLPDSPE